VYPGRGRIKYPANPGLRLARRVPPAAATARPGPAARRPGLVPGNARLCRTNRSWPASDPVPRTAGGRGGGPRPGRGQAARTPWRPRAGTPFAPAAARARGFTRAGAYSRPASAENNACVLAAVAAGPRQIAVSN